MTKKKRGHPDVEEVLARPWCYYCERDFDDLKILISHQKAKHFKCDKCGRRLNTAGGLQVHMNQVHKETLSAIENALPNRSDLNVEIFAMEGIPEDVLQQHKQRVTQQFYADEANRRAESGNPPPGSVTGLGLGAKKPKTESADDLKKRLADFKAKKAGLAVGSGSGEAAPTTKFPNSNTPSTVQSPGPFHGSPAPIPSMPLGYPQPAQSPFQPPFSPNGFAIPPQSPFGNGPSPNYPHGPPSYMPAPQAFVPGMQAPFPHQHYPQSGGVFPPQPVYGASSPQPPLYQQNFQPPPQSASPAQNGSIHRPPSLPPTSGLPQRPSFGAPPVNNFQLQQMHQGYYPNSQPPTASGPDPNIPHRNGQLYAGPAATPSADPRLANRAPESAIDALLAAGSREAQKGEVVQAANPEAAATDKKSKRSKEKEKATRLVYDDDEVSPEEKMAKMPRYAFDPAKRGDDETILGDAVEPTVAGTVDADMPDEGNTE